MNLEVDYPAENRLAKIAAAFCVSLSCAAGRGRRIPARALDRFGCFPANRQDLRDRWRGGHHPGHMTFESSSDFVTISIEEIISGFWMGGRCGGGPSDGPQQPYRDST